MKQWLRQEKGRLVWLGTVTAALGLFFLLRQSRAVQDTLCRYILLPWEQAVGRLCGHLGASVAEILIISLTCAAFFALTRWIRRLIATRFDGTVFFRGVLTFACAGLTVWAGFRLLWTPFYGAESFQEKSGITARGGTTAELRELTARFATALSACADTVARDENGCFAEPRREIIADAAHCYDALYGEFPFLRGDTCPPKEFVLSSILSRFRFTGFYFPFTGEANLNVDSPAAFLGATVCHEMAHQRGIASEQACNFLGVLAATRSDSAAYRYSGYLEGYLYLSNALYRVDENTWWEIRDSLPETVRRDLRENDLYWARFTGRVSKTVQTVYDGFLKANGDENGVRSYGMVVDLLLAYYG